MLRMHLVAVCVVSAALGTGVPLVLAEHEGKPATGWRLSAVHTTLPGLGGSPKTDVVSAALPDLHPARGRAQVVAGPFDDRFTLTHVALDRGRLTGDLTVTSDVSEIIELQVVAGFYDAAGSFLGSATYEKHGESAADVDEHLHFQVAAPVRFADRVASAALGIPVLVNE